MEGEGVASPKDPWKNESRKLGPRDPCRSENICMSYIGWKLSENPHVPRPFTPHLSKRMNIPNEKQCVGSNIPLR